jgi:hypothetical protein
MELIKKQLTLNKGQQRYIFQYAEGCEAQVLDALVASASDAGSDFDWFDAAVLSFKLSQTLIGQADELLCRDVPNPLQSI